MERAHREGVLTSASLMVAERFADEAVEIAKRLPSLRVGLHLTLVDGAPASLPREIPDLVGPDGRFRSDLARMGAETFFLPRARRQLECEITAQFERFKTTSLPLDHVNAHKHYYMHPTVASLATRLAPRYGARWLRAPHEPFAWIDAVEPGAARLAHSAMSPFIANLRALARRNGLRTPDRVAGFRWSGAMTGARLRGLMRTLPEGCTEIYLHPATEGGFAGGARGYRYAEELRGLVEEKTVAEARRLREAGVWIAGFSDLNVKA